MTRFDTPWLDLFWPAPDGLKLHARDYGSGNSARISVVCLPGLARTSGDFHELGSALAAIGRRVLVPDYRGRGLSDYDPDPTHYNLAIESADIQSLLAIADIARAKFVGTSRGGLHIMALAATRPDLIASAVLNDIGPVVETAGLLRIKNYIGQMPHPQNYDEAAAILRTTGSASFPAFSDADWQRMARRTWREAAGRLALDYDPALAQTLATLSPDMPPLTLWPLFDGLAGRPVLAIRGENSDILSPETLAAMAERHPGLETLTIAGQGHAPPLWEEDVVERIVRFVDAADQSERSLKG